MKARVVFGVFGFAFVLLARYVFPPIVLELVVAALCVCATYVVLGSTKLVRIHLEQLLAMAVSLGLAVGHFSILPLRLESVMQGLVLVLLFGSNMAIRASAWHAISGEGCRDPEDVMHEDIDVSLHMLNQGFKTVYSQCMICGISARRMDKSIATIHRYMQRF